MIAGADIFRYGNDWNGTFVLYDRNKLDAPRDPVFWQRREKILVQEIRNVHLPLRVVACYDEQASIGLNTTNAIIARSGIKESLLFVKAIISSVLVNEFFRSCFVDNHIATQYLEAIPIRRIHFTTPAA
ncbi:MAG: TaqI-like C-terminal specificity domain-containing protein, partial [Chloroflexaceae bacterium]